MSGITEQLSEPKQISLHFFSSKNTFDSEQGLYNVINIYIYTRTYKLFLLSNHSKEWSVSSKICTHLKFYTEHLGFFHINWWIRQAFLFTNMSFICDESWKRISICTPSCEVESKCWLMSLKHCIINLINHSELGVMLHNLNTNSPEWIT